VSESVSQKLAWFEKALQLFLDRVRADPNLLAAVLVGSLTEAVWRRDAIALWRGTEIPADPESCFWCR
jgi:hypothetical protein